MLLSTFVVPALAAMGSTVGGATLDRGMHGERFARRLDIFDDDASPTSTAKGGGYLRHSHGFASLLDDVVAERSPTGGIGDGIVGAADRGLSDGIFDDQPTTAHGADLGLPSFLGRDRQLLNEYQCTYGIDGLPGGVHTSRDAAGRCFELNFEVDPPTFRRTNEGAGGGIPSDCVGVFDENASANLGITVTYVSLGTFNAAASTGDTYKFVDGSGCGASGSKRTATVTVIDGVGGLPSVMDAEECGSSLDYVVELSASCLCTPYQLGSNIIGDDGKGSRADGDRFGEALSLSADGTRVAIGGQNHDKSAGTPYAGHARVMEWNGGSWEQLGSDFNGVNYADHLGYALSLSGDGKVVAVAAPYFDYGLGTNEEKLKIGFVKIYEWDGSWNQIGANFYGENANDYLGMAVSLSYTGSMVAIGSQHHGEQAGYVQVFKRNNNNWLQMGNDIPGEAAQDNSGASVSLSADGLTVAIGARNNDGNGSNSGHVRVFRLSGNTWGQVGSDVKGEADDDRFGHPVSLSSDGMRFAAAAQKHGSDSGRVRVYEWSDSSWTIMGSGIDGEAAGDRFGYSTSLSPNGSRLAVGGPFHDGNGHVRIFDWDGTAWQPAAMALLGDGPGDQFGIAVSLSWDGSYLAVGSAYADGIDDLETNVGHVSIYEYPCIETTQAAAYYICHNSNPMTWADHKSLAENKGGSLLAIQNAATNAKAFEMARSYGGSPWIGGYESQVEGQWEWTDGSAWCYENWAVAPTPNGVENCVQLYQGIGVVDSKWNGGACTVGIPALYQFSTDRTGEDSGHIICEHFIPPAPDTCQAIVPNPTYSEHFSIGQVAQSQCTAWNIFRSSLQGSTLVTPANPTSTVSSPFLDLNIDISAPYPYSAVRMSGERDDGVDGVTSITCSDPAKASLIAKALKGATEDEAFGSHGVLISLPCIDPCSLHTYYWTVHNVNGVELSAQKGGPLPCCGCSTLAGIGGTLRPCVGHADGTCTVHPHVGNTNWGGINTRICSAQSQHMAVEFFQSFDSGSDCSTWTSPPVGTTSNNSPLSCSDVDECTVGTDDCDSNASCTNTPGSFSCSCNAGYTGDGTSCADVDECTEGTHDCDPNASCTNTAGSFTCQCNDGYSGDGVTCTDVDECTEGTANCDPNASCTNTNGSFSCSCNEGYAPFDDTCVLTGAATTLAEAQANANDVRANLISYFDAKASLDLAKHNLDVATTNCKDATEAYNEAKALAAERNSMYNQAAEYAKAMEADYTTADALGTCPADRTWKPLIAKTSWEFAAAERELAFAAKDEASTAEDEAHNEQANTCDDALPFAEGEESAATDAYNTARANVDNNPNIPAINPTTFDFIYIDTDGDLIPDDFDACPTKMGLRRDSPEIPGPQDFCPSGCPELLDDNGDLVDSDGDGFPDCEDRCPFQHGIPYNHNWVEGADFSDLPRDLDYNGCPDKDSDGIPDFFDACPDQAGGSCYSGCPDRGIDPSTGSLELPFDADRDGISDCLDRCPNTYGVGLTDGCPDLDMDGVPDHRDYCMATPGYADFFFNRKLEGGQPKYLNILGCPDADGDLVPDPADLCDAPAYPNQGPTTASLATYTNANSEINGVAIVDQNGCPLDSDNDGVYDGVDMCDGTVHSEFPGHDSKAIVFSPYDDEYSASDDDVKLGCPKDSDYDGIADGIDQCPNEGGRTRPDGCPVDTDQDGVRDCVSIDAPVGPYVWPLIHTDCHIVDPLGLVITPPADSCCTVEQDHCPDTPRGATVYADQSHYALFHPDLSSAPNPGCPFDSDGDSVDDGVDLCPTTTPFEIVLADSTDPLDEDKIRIDMKGCAILADFMWGATFIDVTTTSPNGANPFVELLFTVNSDLINVLDSRGYNVGTEMVDVRVMDATCQHTFDDLDHSTAIGDQLLPHTVSVNDKGAFTGQIPFDSSPITVGLNLNPEGIVGSPIWTTDAPFDVGSIAFCLSFAILSDTCEYVTMAELVTTILVDMTQDFEIIDTQVERAEADRVSGLVDIEYPVKVCQCSDDDPSAGPNTCVEQTSPDDDEHTSLDDSFLAQGDALKLCIRFDEDELPPPYVQMVDVKTFTCSQGGLTTIPIQNFVREDDGGQVVYVDTVTSEGNPSPTVDDRMTKINYVVPPSFFGLEERPLDCTGTIVLAFTEGESIGTVRRVLSDVSFNTAFPIERRDETTGADEGESDFAVEVWLGKADSGRRPVAVVACMAIAGVAVTAGLIAVAFTALPSLRLSKLVGGKIRLEATTSETDIESTSAVSGGKDDDNSISEFDYAKPVHATYGRSPTPSISRAHAA